MTNASQKRKPFTSCVFLICSFCFTQSVDAQNKIIKSSPNSKKVAVSLDAKNPLSVGDTLEAVFEDSNTCKIVITKIRETSAVGDATDCDFFEDLRIGLVLRRAAASKGGDYPKQTAAGSPLEEPELPKSRPARSNVASNRKKFGLTAYYNMAPKYELSGIVNGLPYSESGETDGGFGFGLFYMDAPANRFGSFVALDYDLGKEVKNYSGKVAGVPFTGRGTGNDITLLTLASNLTYGLTDLSFLYLGINFPFQIKIENGQEDLYGKIGFQFGLSYRFTDHVFATVEYRILSASGTYSDSGAVGTIDNVSFNGLLLRLGINF